VCITRNVESLADCTCCVFARVCAFQFAVFEKITDNHRIYTQITGTENIYNWIGVLRALKTEPLLEILWGFL